MGWQQKATRGDMNKDTAMTTGPIVQPDGFTTLNEAKALECRADEMGKKADWQQANQLLLQALEKRKSLAGPEDPSIAKILERIAAVYMRQNKLSEAETTLAEAGKIIEAAYYPGHALMAPVLEQQADCLMKQCKNAEAEPFLKRAGDIYVNTLTMENRATLRTSYKLAKLYIQLDQPEEAKKVIEKAMKYVDTPLGPVSEFRYQMALAQVLSKNNNEAKVLFKDASEGFRQRNNYLRVVDCLQNYAAICRTTGDDIQADVAMQEAERYKTLDNFYPEDIFVATLLRA
jgi:tetratricopeptide (TPR) repeat protein